VIAGSARLAGDPVADRLAEGVAARGSRDWDGRRNVYAFFMARFQLRSRRTRTPEGRFAGLPPARFNA
jgi:hypothetical protein